MITITDLIVFISNLLVVLFCIVIVVEVASEMTRGGDEQ